MYITRMIDECKLGVLRHPDPHIGLYREIHMSASAMCGSIDKSGAIDFLFIVVGKTKGILIIDRKLVFPIQTTDGWLPGCHNCLIAIQL